MSTCGSKERAETTCNLPVGFLVAALLPLPFLAIRLPMHLLLLTHACFWDRCHMSWGDSGIQLSSWLPFQPCCCIHIHGSGVVCMEALHQPVHVHELQQQIHVESTPIPRRRRHGDAPSTHLRVLEPRARPPAVPEADACRSAARDLVAESLAFCRRASVGAAIAWRVLSTALLPRFARVLRQLAACEEGWRVVQASTRQSCPRIRAERELEVPGT